MNGAKYLNPRHTTGIFLPDWLLEMNISLAAKLCYGRLGRLAYKRGYAFIRREKLGEILGVTPVQISSYLKELTDTGLIEIKRTGRASHYLFPIIDRMTISGDEMEQREAKFAEDEPDESEYQMKRPHNGRGKETLPPDIKSSLPLHDESRHLNNEFKKENSTSPHAESENLIREFNQRIKNEAGASPLPLNFQKARLKKVTKDVKAAEAEVTKSREISEATVEIAKITVDETKAIYEAVQEGKPVDPLDSALRASLKQQLKYKEQQILDPEIKKWADKIWKSDQKKFKSLIGWIKWAQSKDFTDKVIAIALSEFFPYARDVSDNWWSYITTIIGKVRAKQNAREFEAEHEARKHEEANWAKTLFRNISEIGYVKP